ncbi:exodeoxyribonuclease VII large subunit [Calothrix rhizosoleniae]|uniref:exodeoxyribonuclease VII large subunit n=1 Tax=Calothrix rhizosoleniae TaxID=888997 RepID=UPI000B49EFC0|nr:exodeoxyribonuclease VII large subunit [Calothrix rhizosoleniae]
MTSNIALSVAELTEYIQTLLEKDPQLRQVWVTGEVSSSNHHRSGVFFTLQDPEVGVAIKCVAWNNQLGKLVQFPTVGEQFTVLGSIRLYLQRGEYQLTVWQVLPAGAGLQALRYQQLRNRLQEEGLFAPERKKLLPHHPQTIAIVTSPTAAAWGDMQKTLKSRYPALHILFSPATVQGEQAPDSIARAIQRVEKDGRAEVLILSRGGGAVEELGCFNDERVIRTVANCSIPVITGIGHQRDESLVDLVADVAVHTPTAAAELVVPILADLYNHHRQRIAILQQVVHRELESGINQLNGLENRLRRLRLDRLLDQEIKARDWQSQRLIQAMTGKLQQVTQHINMLQQKLVTLDPKAVLKRGYAVVRQENGVIARSAAELKVGDEVLVHLGAGAARMQVMEVQKNDVD